MKFVKNVDGKTIIGEGKTLHHNGRLIINPTEEDYLAAGYQKVYEEGEESEESDTQTKKKKSKK